MRCNRDKEVYLSRSAAIRVIRGINANAEINKKENAFDAFVNVKSLKRRKVSMKAYHCADCQGWHLMTLNKKKVKPIKSRLLDFKLVDKQQIKKSQRNTILRIKDGIHFKIK